VPGLALGLRGASAVDRRYAVRLILHIGTHKTGTSALQESLRRNEQVLFAKGIYYARGARAKNANGLARLIAKRRIAEAQDFIKRHLREAKSHGAHTLVLSAESFYAMTLFFSKFNGHKYESYWLSEAENIRSLKHLLPAEFETEVVVFFRRQDCFLESLYRQMVKSSRAISLTIDDFKNYTVDSLNYWRHMELWSAELPTCKTYTYERVSTNISRFFFRELLNIECLDKFTDLDLRINNRLSWEVLEYKRLLNATPLSAVDRRMNNLACSQLARLFTHNDVDFLGTKFRCALLEEVAADNLRLAKKYGMNAFPPLKPQQQRAEGAALTDERKSQLMRCHARIKRTPEYQIERLALLTRQFINQRLPFLAWIIPFGRSWLPLHRHQEPRSARR
jgi:hypothetical protein